MKHILAAAAMAALFAAPALAQAPVANPYDQQIRDIYANLDSGTTEKQRVEMQWQAMVLKADAYRHGVEVQVPPQTIQTGAAR